MFRSLEETYDENKYSLERRIRYRILMDYIKKEAPPPINRELVEMIVALHNAQYGEEVFRKYLIEMLEHYG